MKRPFFVVSAIIVLSLLHFSCTTKVVDYRHYSSKDFTCSGVCTCNAGRRSVDCSNQGLDEIPDGIPNDVKIFILNGNKIERIRSQDLKAKSRLRELHLSNNKISDISPDGFKDLVDLEILDLSRNNLGSFHNELLRASNNSLASLNLSNNHISSTESPLFSVPMDRLIELDLSTNGMNALNDGWFEGLGVLKVLKLGQNLVNRLNNTGATLVGLSNLQELYIDTNFFSYIPDASAFAYVRNTLRVLSFAYNQRISDVSELDLPVLTVLNVSYCAISKFSEDIKTPSLITFDMSGNKLQQIPPSVFYDFHQLRDLHISQNSFVVLPYQTLLLVSDSLENMYADYLPLIRISGAAVDTNRTLLHNLRHLSLQYNGISRIENDSFFANMQKLETLMLTYSRLTEIPSVFSNLTILKTLTFDGNLIESVTSGTFPTIPSLVELNLNDLSGLNNIGDEAFAGISDNLKRLTIRNGKVSNVSPLAFREVPSLTELDLSSNLLELAFSEWALEKSLTKFLLSGNQWRCDCNILDFRSWLLSDDYGSINLTDDVICHFPRMLRGNELIKLDESMLICGETECPDVCLCFQDWSGDLSVDCSNEGLADVPSLPPLSAVVQLSNNPFQQLNAKDFVNTSTISKLILASCSLEDIENSTFSQLTQLTELDLNTNRLPSLNKLWFEHLKNLESLRLDQNSLKYLEAGVFESLTQLKFLDISKNIIAIVDANAFQGLMSLERLLLSENHITTLPENVLSSVSLLEMFYIAANKMSRIPPNLVRNLTHFSVLDMGANLFPVLSGQFLHSNSLEYLKMEGGQIETVEANAFEKLPNLRTVRLSENKISNISATAFSTDGSSLLATLDLNRNQLSEVPVAALRNQAHLTAVYFSNNPIVSLNFQQNETCDCPSIETLQFAFTPITEIPENSIFQCFPNTRTVVMNDCELTEIPLNLFRHLPNLESLNLDRTPIDYIHEGSFTQRNVLKDLSLRFSHLKQISNNGFSRLTELKELRLSQGVLEYVSPSAFVNLTNLEVLDISDNLLTLPDSEWFSSADADKLVSVALYGNPWLCNCSVYPYKEWLLNDADSLNSYSLEIFCKDPILYKGMSIKEIDLGQCANTMTSTADAPITDTIWSTTADTLVTDTIWSTTADALVTDTIRSTTAGSLRAILDSILLLFSCILCCVLCL